MMQKCKTLKKYFTNSDYNKFTSEILVAKIKQKELLNKSKFINNSR